MYNKNIKVFICYLQKIAKVTRVTVKEMCLISTDVSKRVKVLSLTCWLSTEDGKCDKDERQGLCLLQKITKCLLSTEYSKYSMKSINVFVIYKR